MPKSVREPIQVYLTAEEREELDRAARELGVSRSEVLRRGVSAVARTRTGRGVLRELTEKGYVTPSLTPADDPPPRARTVPFECLMRELEDDRADR